MKRKKDLGDVQAGSRRMAVVTVKGGGGSGPRSRLEEIDDSPALLAVEAAGRLPQVVGEGEHDALSANGRLDGCDGGRLLAGTGARGSVAASGAGPSGLEVDARLAGAEAVDDVQLALSEGAGLVAGDIRVEEGVDVAADDVHDGAERRGRLLPDVQGLGGGDQAGVSGAGPGALAAGDEAGELGGGAVAVEHGLVTDDDQLDQLPLSPGGDLGDLLLGTGETSVGDEDTEDHLEAGDLAGRADILERVAVGGVDADGGESLELDEGNVGVDLGGRLASTAVLIGSVGHGPLLA